MTQMPTDIAVLVSCLQMAHMSYRVRKNGDPSTKPCPEDLRAELRSTIAECSRAQERAKLQRPGALREGMIKRAAKAVEHAEHARAWLAKMEATCNE